MVKLIGETRKKESNNGLIFERSVQKTVFHAQLQQLRDPEDSDDMGVAIVKALEEATRQHLTNIGVQEDDRIFLAMTPQGFEHAYQTVAFPVHEFVEGSTRLEELMRKLAGKLNPSNPTRSLGSRAGETVERGTRGEELHRDAGVPEGPCGLPELQKFQTFLSTLDPPYQLKVLSRQHPFFLIFRCPDANVSYFMLLYANLC